MKLAALFIALWCFVEVKQSVTGASTPQLLCYYDPGHVGRQGNFRMSTTDLETAAQFCTHLIYGYANLDPSTHKIVAKDIKRDLDIGGGLYHVVTDMKKKFPHLKVLLSVGGDKDEVDPDNNQYLTMLKDSTARIAFINSAHTILTSYKFDGLDLAWQFKKNKAKKEHGALGSFWKSIKKTFTGDYVVDEDAAEHMKGFTTLVQDLKNALRIDNLMLGITVLPNVDSALYYDVPAIINKVDYVNLFAFDFQTPERNPEVADHAAPLQELEERNPKSNIAAQVKYWVDNSPKSKINIGVPTYGRAWSLSADSGSTGYPPVLKTKGPAPSGPPNDGLFAWTEICTRFLNANNKNEKGNKAPLRRVNDVSKRFGPYAYHVSEANEEDSVWVTYTDPDFAATKAKYVVDNNLGGVALVDLALDDFRGTCSNEQFPILRAIKYILK